MKTKFIILVPFFVLLISCIPTYAKEALNENSIASAMVSSGLTNIEYFNDVNNPASRLDFTLILLNIYESASQNAALPITNTFKDLKSSPYSAQIEKAYKLGLVNGTGSTTFSPSSGVTREQAAFLIINFIDKMNANIAPSNVRVNFTDSNDIADYAVSSVSRCVSNGFMEEYSENEFAPKVFLSKEEAIILLYKLADKLEITKKPPSQSVLINYDRGNDFYVYENNAFFLQNNKLYMLNLKNKDPIPQTLIDSTITAAHVEDGIIYAVEQLTESKSQLITININTAEKTVITPLVTGCSLAFEDGYIYVISGYKYVYKMKTDGSFASTVFNSPTRIWDLHVHNGYVYFNKDRTGLVRIKSNATEQSVITEKAPEKFTINNSLIYLLYNTEAADSQHTPYDLYYADLSQQKHKIEKILERISNVYSTEYGVFAYNGEPLDSNSVYSLKGNTTQRINTSGIKLLTQNNAQNLRFTRDGKLYFSVFKPVSLDDVLDNQVYQYTNVIDLKTGIADSLTSGGAVIHSYKELETVYNKMPYRFFSKIDKKDKAIILKADQVYKEIIKGNQTEAQKEKAIHDYIVSTTSYSINSVTTEPVTKTYSFYSNNFNPTYLSNFHEDIYTPYGVLLNKKAVCQGYSETMKMLLTMAGIECYYVTGVAMSGGKYYNHAWNIVKISGNYYHVDSTWDDTVPDVSNKVLYRFFNLTDEQISKTHKINETQVYPKCVTVWSN